MQKIYVVILCLSGVYNYSAAELSRASLHSAKAVELMDQEELTQEVTQLREYFTESHELIARKLRGAEGRQRRAEDLVNVLRVQLAEKAAQVVQLECALQQTQAQCRQQAVDATKFAVIILQLEQQAQALKHQLTHQQHEYRLADVQNQQLRRDQDMLQVQLAANIAFPEVELAAARQTILTLKNELYWARQQRGRAKAARATPASAAQQQ